MNSNKAVVEWLRHNCSRCNRSSSPRLLGRRLLTYSLVKLEGRIGNVLAERVILLSLGRHSCTASINYVASLALSLLHLSGAAARGL